MRARIRSDLCQGHGMCILACPELFRLDDDDGHAVLIQEDIPEYLRESVDQAVRSCPEQAIVTTSE